MTLARRVEQLPAYLFAQISKKVAQKRAEGVDIISFGIGDPDLPTPPHILEALIDASRDPANHRYPETDGLPELRKSIAGWYERRFGVALDPDKEVVPLIGSKEGIGHIPLCIIDPGDLAICPTPGYPVYSVSVELCGGTNYELSLREDRGFLPDFDAIPSDIADSAKLLWLNYPNNPTAAVADLDFFDRAVAFAKKHDIVIVHDMAYSEVAYDEFVPPSFLEAKRARDVSIEVHSLSKSYNMTGWRCGAIVGNADAIAHYWKLKTNVDSGLFEAVQVAGAEALNASQQPVREMAAIYSRRRDLVIDALREIGIDIEPPKGTIYVWAPVPQGHTSASFAEEVLEQAGVVVSPGSSYGPNGEGFFRISLTVPDERLTEAVERMRGSLA
jgi:LL-diaminopimelate aminotransferase